MDDIANLKNTHNEGPIPSVWRPLIRRIVEAFVRGDYLLSEPISGVAPVSAETASHIAASIEKYGETLAPLPDASWDTSVCIWYGDHWDALIDLWTVGEGASDLVLGLRINEGAKGFIVHVQMVYVP